MLSSMDLPTTEVDLGPEKIEDEKEGGLPFRCDLCDTEVVHKVAQMFMPGLATACVDNTSGDIFRTPGSVAADLRSEMTDYLTRRSESFVAESVILQGGPEAEVSDNPFDIISDFVDDFASSKRNLFSRVSGWLLNEKREDKIDDFIQDMEKDGFWSLDKREAIAETLLKNVDFKCSFHCSMKFNSEGELANHVYNCSFRCMICENEGCDSRFCAANLEKHDAICPFKIIPCEQKCSDSIMRRAMDRHCITICPMRLVNCPFYSVGCRVAIQQCNIEKHRSDYLHSHLLYILQGLYRKASEEDLKQRVKQIVQAESNSRLAGARDVRPLKNIVKELEAKLGPFEVSAMNENGEQKNAKDEDAEDGDMEKKGTEQTANIANSSENSEVSSIMNNNAAENNVNIEDRDSEMKNEGGEVSAMKKNSEEKNAKDEDTEDGDMEKKGTEQTANMANSEVSSIININTAENNVNSEDRDSQMKNEGGEESTQYSNMENSEVSSIMNNNTPENNVNSEDRDSQMKNEGGEESAQNANMANSSDKPEVSAVNKDTAETCKEKDAEDSSLEIKGNEESKQTNLANSL